MTTRKPRMWIFGALCVLTSFAQLGGTVLQNNISLIERTTTEETTATSDPAKEIKCGSCCCVCNRGMASCTGQYMKHLPRLSPDVRGFMLFLGNLRHLTRSMLARLTNVQLRKINLSRCKIYHVQPEAFADFAHLEVLDLSGNPVPMPELRACLTGITSRSMHAVTLTNMGLAFLPDDFFAVFSNMTFTKVDLQKNHLEAFNTAVFAPFRFIERLFLSENRIQEVNTSHEVSLEKLTLHGNLFREFPDFCCGQLFTKGKAEKVKAFWNLRGLYIGNNPIIQIDPDILRGACLPDLRKLDISWMANVKVLKDNFISDLPNLVHLQVNHMTQLTRYEPEAFNSSSLHILSMNNNRRLNKEVLEPRYVFLHCPNLQKLHIMNTKVDMYDEDVYQLLLPLKSLTKLILHSISKGSLPPDLLWRLPNLKTLAFTGNNLVSSTLGRALANVTTLTRLEVNANRITVVNENTLPWEFRRTVKWLDMSKNPFSCTCDLMWFRSWLEAVQKNKSVMVKAYPSYNKRFSTYRCHSPVSWKNKDLRDFFASEDLCTVQNPYVVVGVAGGCVLMGLVVLVLAVYRYRWHLRFYLYRLRRSRQLPSQVPGGLLTGGEAVEFFPFDAYLAHSAQDLDWIHDELLPLVEVEHGLRLFVEERDSIPGSLIVDNITKYMDESARVLLVISDSYNREGWRQCEFEHILYAAIEQHKDVIVVLLGNVEAGRMTRDMRRMLTRGTFLQWGASEEAGRAFRDGLKVALRTQDNHLLSSC